MSRELGSDATPGYGRCVNPLRGPVGGPKPPADPSVGIAVWTGSTSFTYNCGSCITTTLSTRFTMSLSGAGATQFIPSTDLLGIDSLFDTSQSVVAEVTGDFGVNFLYEAYFGGSWQPVLDLFDSQQTDPGASVITDHGGSFYSTPVPEPSTALLLGLGLVGFAGRRRRR
jgi:hypothetical protein